MPADALAVHEEIVWEQVEIATAWGKKLSDMEIGNGDILVLSRQQAGEEGDAVAQPAPSLVAYPTAKEYLFSLGNRLEVTFRWLNAPKSDVVVLALSKADLHDTVAQVVAEAVSTEDNPVHWSHLRFTGHNTFQDMPRHVPHRRIAYAHYQPSKQTTLVDMCRAYQELARQQYMEVLEFPLSEMEAKDLVTIHMMSGDLPAGELYLEVKLLVQKGANITVLSEDLKAKLLELGQPVITRQLRFFTSQSGMVHKAALNFHTMLHSVSEYIIQAEEMSEYEVSERELDRLPANKHQRSMLNVCHFNLFSSQNLVHTYGQPFQIVLHKGETLGELKARLHNAVKNKFTEEQFAKFKFAVLKEHDIRRKPVYFESDGECTLVPLHLPLY